MAGNPTATPDQAAGNQPGRTSDLMLIEIAKLQSDGEYIKRDLGELRSELRSEVRDIRGEIKEFRAEVASEFKDVRAEFKDVRAEIGGVRSETGSLRSDISSLRDRITRLEERVAHLPGKGFIVVVVTSAMVLIGGFTTIVPRLQSTTLTIPSPSSPSTAR